MLVKVTKISHGVKQVDSLHYHLKCKAANQPDSLLTDLGMLSLTTFIKQLTMYCG